MSKKYMIKLECSNDGRIVLGWLRDAHFKCWSTAGVTTALSSMSPHFVEVISCDSRFEAWFSLKLETSIKDLSAGVEYYIKLN